MTREACRAKFVGDGAEQIRRRARVGFLDLARFCNDVSQPENLSRIFHEPEGVRRYRDFS